MALGQNKQNAHTLPGNDYAIIMIIIIIIVIIITIMDGSCIAQIFPSRKLNALAHTIHANMYTNMNIF